MSSFSVDMVQLDVAPHPYADRLDRATPLGTVYEAVVQKDRFASGDCALYVPEGAVVPERVLRASGFWDDEQGKGMLAGPNGDRVKPIRLRGVLSQGIFIDIPTATGLLADAGTEWDGALKIDWADALGIEKYVPPIPKEMSGRVYPVDGLRGYTDIEDAKKFPSVFDESFGGEPVVATEKLHGTCTIITLLCNDEGYWTMHVASKGLASKGLALEWSEANVYWRSAKSIGGRPTLERIGSIFGAQREVTVFGETLGVQDLKYGYDGSEVGFRVFDVRVDGRYLDYATDFSYAAESVSLPVVPALYYGPYDEAKIWDLASGGTEVEGAPENHIREGVVVKPDYERRDDLLGRVILKYVSPNYLTRKSKNATEFE